MPVGNEGVVVEVGAPAGARKWVLVLLQEMHGFLVVLSHGVGLRNGSLLDLVIVEVVVLHPELTIYVDNLFLLSHHLRSKVLLRLVQI